MGQRRGWVWCRVTVGGAESQSETSAPKRARPGAHAKAAARKCGFRLPRRRRGRQRRWRSGRRLDGTLRRHSGEHAAAACRTRNIRGLRHGGGGNGGRRLDGTLRHHSGEHAAAACRTRNIRGLRHGGGGNGGRRLDGTLRRHSGEHAAAAAWPCRSRRGGRLRGVRATGHVCGQHSGSRMGRGDRRGRARRWRDRRKAGGPGPGAESGERQHSPGAAAGRRWRDRRLFGGGWPDGRRRHGDRPQAEEAAPWCRPFFPISAHGINWPRNTW